jgi:tetratricopeptide (TPR) repeat protein
MLGYPDQSVETSDETNVHARRLGLAFNLGFSLTLGAYVFDYRCEPERLLERVGEADRLAREQSIPILYMVMVPQVEGLARLRNGQPSEAISLLRRAIENWNRLGGYNRVPYLKSALAEAMALQGDMDAALHLIDESLEQVERPGWEERCHYAEILRLKGWMLSLKDDLAGAEKNYLASLDWARKQQAKSWELRTSTSLARLWQGQGKRKEAHKLLAPIYNWFTEGFDTADLIDAKALLAQLE